MESQKKTNVPLEEALNIAGTGLYSWCIMCAAGLSIFTGFSSSQAMSVVVTAASCDLNITSYQKGVLSSIGYFGMIFSSHLFGVLADTFGRKRIIVICCTITGIVTLISSLSPNVEALMVAFFINGFLVGGIFTPGYVFVGEFCPAAVRATGLIVVVSCGTLVNIFLPCFAWLILPIEINQPLFSGVVFTSWRLFLALLSLPQFLCATVFTQIPETPKFLLNDGKYSETLEVLKSIYTVNRRKMKDDFPVASVCLDGIDESVKKQIENVSCKEYFQNLVQNTAILFTPKYLLYTLLSCATVFNLGGIYNIIILWMPEEVRQLTLFENTHSYYNVTLCDVMSNKVEIAIEHQCTLNYEAFIPGIIIGALQFTCVHITNIIVKFTGPKILTVAQAALAATASIVLVFIDVYYVTIFCLGAMIVLFSSMFPVLLSIIVTYFPTTLRSNATSIIMLCGRIISFIGTQTLGAVFHTHCELAYGIISVSIIGQVFYCLFMPMNVS